MKKNTSKTSQKKNLTNKLSSILCDEYILLTKTKNAEKNIQNIDFQADYAFFKAQSSEMNLIIEHIEKRVHNLGYYADALLKAFLKVMRFNKKKKKINDCAGYLKELLYDHENIITVLKNNTPLLQIATNGKQTDDFVTTLMESHEKMVWFLRSYLK